MNRQKIKITTKSNTFKSRLDLKISEVAKNEDVSS